MEQRGPAPTPRTAAVGSNGNPRSFLFHDESGRPGSGSHFIVGLLRVDAKDVPTVRRRLMEIRQTYRFTNELHFNKMSGWREKVYEAVIRDMLTAPVRFSALVVDNAQVDMKRFANQEHLCYNFFTKQLIYHRARRHRRDYVVLTDAKPRMRHDNFIHYLEGLLNFELYVDSGSSIDRVIPVDSKRVQLLQVCDLFTGLVANTVTGGEPGSRKTELRHRLTAASGWRATVDVWHWKPH